MTILDPVHDPDQLDLLSIIADPWTAVTGAPFAARFRAACWEVARHHDGWVDPNAVARLMRADDPDLDTRRYSAMWVPAQHSVKGFLDRTDVPVQLDGRTSRGNANKQTSYRRWREGCAP